MSGRLGELLVRENLISLQQLQKAQDEQRKTGGRIGSLLVKQGAIAESDLTGFLSKQYGVPAISLKDFDIDEEVLKLVPKATAEKHQVIPVNRAGSSLIVAMSDPSNIFAIDDVKFLTGYNVEVVVASEQAIREAIEKYYAEKGPDLDEVMQGFDDSEVAIIEADGDDMNVVDLEKSAEEAPVVKLVNLILLDAIKKGASDIHVEPYEKDFRVRFRIDGVLYEVMKPPMKLRNAIISRLKIMSELDISERRLPQDGRIKLKLGKGKEMDFRVSICPTLFGEKVVMRLLDKSNLQLDMTKLGFEEQQLKDFMEAIDRPYGMVLVTGPTGSGKTTTLYSALSKLNEVAWNISTAEDPVEFNFFGINQVQMHEDIGLNFAAALRSFLRQDPDIIMVGEIRDFETAEIGVKAALTGHLVLSTLHTNDAPGTVSRLLNMGIEPFLVTASLNAIVAQRLCRRLCPECRKPVAPDEQALLDAGFPAEQIGSFQVYEPGGCKACNDRGYKGRVAVYEVMPLWDGLKELVIQGCSAAELKQEAIRLGFHTLRMSALNKVKSGMTSLAEAVGNTAPDKF
ncbi:type IV-A pilus assembly ATPase PilB [Anaeromyxobacter dehalogenans]|uniref:Type II secretion system protein E n=1 Tax=Anaeromyxobacter dehalogenans (strain 2CP-C) TaxID=290397 RepID=Q2INM0_ANADE|nr:type IV-A pilus assembly ATPase PilB [Anaeromyxobacter dehalogenans]ABC80398.1 type II secretion system protein E [Anaeromyxobacter dehalogenans 2CP-C]